MLDRGLLVLAVAAGLSAIGSDAGAGDSGAASESFFELKVRPVLAGTCVKCHGEKKASGGLRLDSREAMLEGGDGGPAVVPGDPGRSPLVRAVRHDDDTLKMPPNKALDRDAQDALAAWVAAGVPWPKSGAAGPIRSQSHWAFEPLRTITPPVDPTGWASRPIDRLVAAGHRSGGLHPVARADRRTLIRRATFDLIGLPPSRRGSRRSSGTIGPTPSRGWSTSCWPRPGTASDGAATGSTSPGTPTRPATTPTTRSPRPTSIATT